MNAECARPTCEEPARVLLAFDPRTARAWLRDLDNGDPSMGLILCTEHAESTSVPVSWEIVDERRTVPEFSSEVYDSEPSFDDIFPPRAGYSNWDNIPYQEPYSAPAPVGDPNAIHQYGDVRRGEPTQDDDRRRHAPRNSDGGAVTDGGAAIDGRAVTDGGAAIDGRSGALSDTTDPAVQSQRTGVEPAAGAQLHPSRESMAPPRPQPSWYEAEAVPPGWLERTESLDFGLDEYYDPYLDDPELGEDLASPAAPPVAFDPSPSPAGAESAVSPLVPPGSPHEQVPASDLLAAASVDPPQPIPPRPARPAVRDPAEYKDAVRLPERADRPRQAVSQPRETASTDSGRRENLAASGTDGAPFPPHPGARNADS